MIVQEHFTINGREFIRTYSDAGRYVVGGYLEVQYLEANDPAEFERKYVEGDTNTEEAGPEDYEQPLEEMGVNFSD